MGAIVAALIAFGFFYYIAKPNNLFTYLLRRSHQPSQQGETGNEPLSGTTFLPGARKAGIFSSRKRIVLFVIGCGVAGGLITFAAFAADDASISVDLSHAQVSGQAKIVANSSAIDGSMVQFGAGSTTVNKTITTGAASTSASASSKKTSSSSTSNKSSGSSTPPSGSNCTDPSWSSSDAEATDNTDPNDGDQYWWVNNDAWSGSHGPQTIYDCNQSSWYVSSNQPDNGGQVETYPDTEYDVGGRANGTTKTLAQYHSITSTFSENFPSSGSWDAGYDLWLNNWSIETMIWNQWAGSQAYWYSQATTAASLDGVAYKFIDNGGELIFMRESQVKSGSVDILAAYNWLIAHGYVHSSDVPTQLEYGVEICSTNGTESFPMTGLTFSLN